MKKMLVGTLIVVVSLFMVSASSVIAQDDFCVADFDYSGGVDVGAFLDEYLQRTIYSNPCPPERPQYIVFTQVKLLFRSLSDFLSP